MTARARQLAESCFAVARSTTHAGERQNAIGRGEAICRKHGFSLDDFDIPGRRPRAAPRPETSFRFAAGSFEGGGDELTDFLRAFESLKRSFDAAAARAGAAEDETPYDARRRNFDRETAAAAERDRRRRAC